MQRTLNRVPHENFHVAFAEILNVVIQSPVVDGLDCLLQDIDGSAARRPGSYCPFARLRFFVGSGGNCAKTNSPVSSVVAYRDCPVSVFFTVTTAPDQCF